MKKYKLLRFGHCYINPDGSFTVGLLRGTKKKGYWFAASHAAPHAVCLHEIMVLSRVVPNDGYWTEIPMKTFFAVFDAHISGCKAKPAQKGGSGLIISKY
jgi:hypothetical protein